MAPRAHSVPTDINSQAVVVGTMPLDSAATMPKNWQSPSLEDLKADSSGCDGYTGAYDGLLDIPFGSAPATNPVSLSSSDESFARF